MEDRLKCQISPLVKYRQKKCNSYPMSRHYTHCLMMPLYIYVLYIRFVMNVCCCLPPNFYYQLYQIYTCKIHCNRLSWTGRGRRQIRSSKFDILHWNPSKANFFRTRPNVQFRGASGSKIIFTGRSRFRTTCNVWYMVESGSEGLQGFPVLLIL